jgi:hypothetical protein
MKKRRDVGLCVHPTLKVAELPHRNKDGLKPGLVMLI